MGGCRLGGVEGGESVFDGNSWVGCGEESGQENQVQLVGHRREALCGHARASSRTWRGSPSGRVLSGSAPNNAGGSNVV